MIDPKNKESVSAVDVSDEKIHWDTDMSYGEYLQLEKVLNAQHSLADQHDEMLFIIMHQTAELWMKLCLHELQAAMQKIREDNLRPAFKMLSRVSRIQAQILQSWEVLTTMTPADYLEFRDALGQSSGFQSYQYRLMEYSIGNKNAALMKVHKNNPEVYKTLEKALAAPSLYDEVLILLKKRGYDIPEAYANRDWSQPYKPSQNIENVWKTIYQNANDHWDVYELAEKLVDLEYNFQKWRFSHLKTVERIIGMRRGTGGSAGVSYLQKALDLSFFPELWSVRTEI